MGRFLIRYTSEIILIIYVLLFIGLKQPGQPWDRVINSDGKGYYAYLTAIFIYNDLDYSFIEDYESKYYPADKTAFKEFRMPFNGEIANKTFSGLALLWLPFFLLAHLFSSVLGFESDGYSLIYQYAIALATLFYLWAGCRLLLRLVRKYTSSSVIASFIVFTIALGTNIMYYAIVEPSMAHIYSFAVITAFLWFIKQAAETRKGKWYILASFAYGLTITIRPTNGIFIFLIPFIAGSMENTKSFFSRFFSDQKALFYSLLSFGSVLAIPVILWYVQTGFFFVYSYGDEGFNFTDPHFFDILFSYNKGWFVYTPVAFVSIFGFIYLIRKQKFMFSVLIILLVIHIYISSCWWVWHYTSKFSQRVFIDFYAIVAILLAFLFNSIKGKLLLRKSLALLLYLLVIFNVIQFYQHMKWVFPYGDINREIYWDSFTRMTPRAKVYLPDNNIIQKEEILHDMESPKGWTNEHTLNYNSAAGNTYCLINNDNPFSIEFREPFHHRFSTTNGIIRVECDIQSNVRFSEAAFVIEFESGIGSYSYNPVYLREYNKKDIWTHIEFAIYMPPVIASNDFVKIFFHNESSSENLKIDNLQIAFITFPENQPEIDGVIKPANRVIRRDQFMHDMETDIGWGNYKTVTDELAFEGEKSSITGPENPFSINYNMPLTLYNQVGHTWLRSSAQVFSETVNKDARMVFELTRGNQAVKYLPCFLERQLVPGEWTQIEFLADITEFAQTGDKIKIYYWNPSESKLMYIDNMIVELITLNENK